MKNVEVARVKFLIKQLDCEEIQQKKKVLEALNYFNH